MNKEHLRDILLLQNDFTPKEIVERTLSNKLSSLAKTPFIIIISGIRRCGKSTLINTLRGKDAYYVNFDDERFIDFTVNDFQMLYELLMELFGEKKIFLFDEIQVIWGWERFVRRLHDDDNKIYVTGSNASMLSRELGTHLTGRNISLSLFPFSFKEFLREKKFELTINLTSVEKSKIKKFFSEYFLEGGFPEFLSTKKEEYLKNIYENIIYRDIITRYNLKKEKPLKEVVVYLASNIAKELSFNTLKKLSGLTSATTIKEYLSYLENSYLLFSLNKYDFSLKKQVYANKKIYFIDNALARIIGFRSSEDKGRLLENLVFIELKRRNKELYYHKAKKECDFLIKEGLKITEAIQVCYELTQDNEKREMDGLLEAMSIHKLKEGLLLTYDQEKEIKIQNKLIKVLPIWKWLLKE